MATKNDKKVYQDVLLAVLAANSIPAAKASLHIKLLKIATITEDDTLKAMLEHLLDHMLTAGRTTITPDGGTGMIFSRHPPLDFDPLVAYCRGMVNSFKPQWQLIAEQHGWSPP